ncbi:MAG: DUF3467 domain-containing protein [Candidatus Cloacimonas sp.]|jgi:hypothetical protein|nr:DUF3467 domain-containing protein [Candidatus Cloacimonadota bacterium]
MEKQKKINVKIDEAVGQGTYSNFFMVTYSPSEFIMDFGRLLPGIPDVKIYSRVVTTPQHAKQFLNLLQKNVEQFEAQNGEIKIAGQGSNENKGVGFKNIP